MAQPNFFQVPCRALDQGRDTTTYGLAINRRLEPAASSLCLELRADSKFSLPGPDAPSNEAARGGLHISLNAGQTSFPSKLLVKARA
jgi:hypothetical protein